VCACACLGVRVVWCVCRCASKCVQVCGLAHVCEHGNSRLHLYLALMDLFQAPAAGYLHVVNADEILQVFMQL